MGKLRCISKPIKRFYFAHADNISNKWAKIVSNKYTLKYIKKLKKLNYSIDPLEYSSIPGLVEFIEELTTKLDQEKGLAHSKVREYWLRRGPRLIIVLILTIMFTIGMSHWIIDTTKKDNILSILIGINMILFNAYMLYQRLIDAISGAMMRIGHDHYTIWKMGIKNEIIY